MDKDAPKLRLGRWIQAPAKAESPLWRQHFATILSTVATAITGALGYFFVTLHEEDSKRAQFLLERMTRLEALAIQRDQLAIALAKSDLEQRRGNLQSANDVAVFIPKLLRGEANEVEHAAISLAVGGKSNTDVIVATLANTVKNQEELVSGLRVAAVANHHETCAALCAHAAYFTVEDNNTVGNLAKALGDLRCNEARDLLIGWLGQYKPGVAPNGNITDALKQLKAPKPDRPTPVSERRTSCGGA